MKKLMICLAALLFMFSCETEHNDNIDSLPSDITSIEKQTTDLFVTQRQCSATEVNDRIVTEHPEIIDRQIKIEQHTNLFINAPGGGKGKPGGGGGGGEPPVGFEGVVTIPVIVHVVSSNSQEDISDQQINSQISVMNNDFAASNNDVGSVPTEFAGSVSNSEIEFVLDRVIRVTSSVTSWGTNDAVKYSSNGGSDVIDPANYLNIWVANIGGGILGYAQFPGGPANTDGVVISPQYFGTTGTATAPFDGGRTGTHEVGHWLNLRHIWGDGRCNRDDSVSDTPSSDRPNYGCPGYPTQHCRSTDMTMNYMDYTNDDCMYMFTTGQTDRMRALFASGGEREDFVQ